MVVVVAFTALETLAMLGKAGPALALGLPPSLALMNLSTSASYSSSESD
jgi:hypothetical protein